eukprot:NODE_20_length_4524_cov_21.761564_g17_i0.p1 GENE.NODE_20_length_4524_cov_21.761564_g17_i0~~NODE_20_length_4524_cov_21.761564_g17_i0.p1  ORF type:complete len:1040 (+),score=208.96 NODE_20_length_4524_cov_21.761564_g17_i0:1316-4435(+)
MVLQREHREGMLEVYEWNRREAFWRVEELEAHGRASLESEEISGRNDVVTAVRRGAWLDYCTLRMPALVVMARRLETMHLPGRVEISEVEQRERLVLAEAEFSQRHKRSRWVLAETESVTRCDIKEEWATGWDRLTRRQQCELAQLSLWLAERAERRILVQDRLREATQMAMDLREALVELATRERTERRERWESTQRDRRNREQVETALAEPVFWEMRKRWEIEGEEDRAWKELLELESGSFSSAENAALSRFSRLDAQRRQNELKAADQREQERLAGFPVFAPGPPEQPLKLQKTLPGDYGRPKSPAIEDNSSALELRRLQEEHWMASETIHANYRLKAQLQLREMDTRAALIHEATRTLAGVRAMASGERFALQRHDLLLREWKLRERLEDEEAVARSAAPFAAGRSPVERSQIILYDESKRGKELLSQDALAWSVVLHDSLHLWITETTVRQRIGRDEYVAREQVRKWHERFSDTTRTDFMWTEHHARLALYLEQQDGFLRIQQRYELAVQSLQRDRLFIELRRNELMARREVEREEWSEGYQIQIAFEDAAPERALILWIDEETTARSAVEADEVTSRKEISSRCSTSSSHIVTAGARLLGKDESTARRRIFLEEIRRREDLVEAEAQQTVTAMEHARERATLDIQSWYRGELARTEMRKRKHLRHNESKIVKLQAFWRGERGRKHARNKRIRSQRKISAAPRLRELEAIERVEMEENEKLSLLVSVQRDRATFLVASGEQSGRRDIERVERREWLALERMEMGSRPRELRRISAPRALSPVLAAQTSSHAAATPAVALYHIPSPGCGPASSPFSLTALINSRPPTPGDGEFHGDTQGPLRRMSMRFVLPSSAEVSRRREQRELEAAQQHNAALCDKILDMFSATLANDAKFAEENFAMNETLRKLPSLENPPTLGMVFRASDDGGLSDSLGMSMPPRGLAPIQAAPPNQRLIRPAPRTQPRASHIADLKKYALREPLADYSQTLYYNTDPADQGSQAKDPVEESPRSPQRRLGRPLVLNVNPTTRTPNFEDMD